MNRRASAKSILRRNSSLLAAVALAVASFQAGCVSVVRTGAESGLPPESRFVRNEVAIPGTARSYPLWRTRSPGRPVLLLPPINGLSGDFLRFALEMETWGYRVYFPSLYGDPVRGEPAFGYDRELGSIRLLKESGTWNPVSSESTGPIVGDVRTMARWVSRREGGSGLIVIGNSLTGAFPLALLDEPCVRTAVLGQPALPAMRVPQVMLRIPQSPGKRKAIPLREEDWKRVLAALHADPGKRILGFHYEDDPVAAIERFDTLHTRLAAAGLGSRFRAFVLAAPGAELRGAWVTSAETKERRGMLTPHSTFLDAGNAEDLRWFRERLRAELAR